MAFENTRKLLQNLGLPAGDLVDLPSSQDTFTDQAHFRIEVPTVNSLEAAQALLEESASRGVTVNRITETLGLFRHSTSEIEDYVALAKQYGAELLMSIGPRAVYDIGASAHSQQGSYVGYRLRGCEQLVYAIEDVKRGIELGVRGFVVYDEGLLWVLNDLRSSGELPADVKLKVSAHCGHANPASFKMLESLGADSINPIRDLSLATLASLRQSVKVPLDCHTDNPPASGGFVRFYEAPEMVRVASPVYLKVGNSVLSTHGQRVSSDQGRLMAAQVEIVCEMLARHNPSARQSGAIPAPALRVMRNV